MKHLQLHGNQNLKFGEKSSRRRWSRLTGHLGQMFLCWQWNPSSSLLPMDKKE